MNFELTDTPELPQELVINSEHFTFLKVRDFSQGLLYRNENSYLRIGDPEKIQHELKCHRGFESTGFPVGKILAEGEYEGQSYYQEESIGEKPFHIIFQEETQKNRRISDSSFENFLEVIKLCVNTQLKNAESSNDSLIEEYFETWLFDVVKEEASHLSELMESAKVKMKETLASHPAVLSHNDFNAYNILPEGLIDFAYGGKMPLGYDWVSVVRHQDFFPVGDEFESKQKYAFTEEQQATFLEIFREAARQKNIDFDEIFSTLYLGRLMWSAAHMGRHPRLQAWRFQKLESLLKQYLEG